MIFKQHFLNQIIGRLQLMTNLESSFDINMSIMNECFAHDLINDLVRAYLSTTDSNDADACAFSIQEVLKVQIMSKMRMEDVWLSINPTSFILGIFYYRCRLSKHSKGQCLAQIRRCH